MSVLLVCGANNWRTILLLVEERNTAKIGAITDLSQKSRQKQIFSPVLHNNNVCLLIINN